MLRGQGANIVLFSAWQQMGSVSGVCPTLPGLSQVEPLERLLRGSLSVRVGRASYVRGYRAAQCCVPPRPEATVLQ